MAKVETNERSKGRKKSRAFKYMLVYCYLKSKNREPEYLGGMSKCEISKGVRDTYNLSGGQLLKKQVAAALRCGVDYGIVKRIKDKYRYDPDSSAVSSWKQECGKSKKKSSKPATPKRQPVPRPRVPRPPSFKERQRNLREEPMPRIRKHPGTNFSEDKIDSRTSLL